MEQLFVTHLRLQVLQYIKIDKNYSVLSLDFEFSNVKIFFHAIIKSHLINLYLRIKTNVMILSKIDL